MSSWVKDAAEVVKAAGEAVNQSGVIDKIGNAITALASKLGVAAEHVYKILAKQAVVESVTNSVLYLFFFGLIVAFGFAAKYYHGKAVFDSGGNAQNSEGVGFIAACGATVVAILIFFFFFINTISDTVTGYVNPEYKAITSIAEMIKTQSVPDTGVRR